MQLIMSNNKIIIAAAGAGKTQQIIEKVKNNSDKKILVTTFTNNNLNEIRERLSKFDVSNRVDILTLDNFLLSHCAKPYQSRILDTKLGRIKSIDFQSKQAFIKKENSNSYYLNKNKDIYKNMLTEFICEIPFDGKNLIFDRLSCIYDIIIVDEIQDINGKYDLDLFELLLSSGIEIFLVGDPRQSILNTNTSSKGKKNEKGVNIINRFKDWEKNNLCEIQELNISYRCSQEICDFADNLFPKFSKTKSQNNSVTHSGVFLIKNDEESIKAYLEQYPCKVLRFNKDTEIYGLNGLNIGLSKGKTYDRVLIFFPKSINKYLASNDLGLFAKKTLAYLYVAVTRAKYSAMVVSDTDAVAVEYITRFKTIKDNLSLF
jgi:DNA helicase-2/ATP-dependent DNA helicase PcrA